MHSTTLHATRLSLALAAAFAAAPALAAGDCVDGENAYNCYVPEGKDTVTIEAWGAGGGGSAGNTAGQGGGGGGGGSYCKATFSVTPGDYLTVEVGAGGSGSTVTGTHGTKGGDSSVSGSTISGLVAEGGGRGMGSGSGGSSGSVADCTAAGAVRYRGGNGGTGTFAANGGGGGSSASATAEGNDGASNISGGQGWNGSATGPGSGGSGGFGSLPVFMSARPGYTPGGGGGGGGSITATNLAGAAGAAGRVVMTFGASGPTVPGAPASASAVAGDGAARVSWTPPSATGGSPVTGYVARAFTLADALAGSCTAAADAASCDIALDNGVPYVFKAYALNTVGEGPAATAPDTPTPSGFAYPTSAPGMSGVVGVHMNGNQPGCTLSAQPAFSDSGIPGGAPAQASFPVGAFSFAATGCKGDTLTVRIDFPQALPDNVQLMKFGPKTALAPTSEWFPAPGAHISQDRKTVIYTVQDNGPGDSNPAEGVIADPFAPMALPPQPAAPASIPTLSEWGLALLSLLAAAFGLRAARRKV